MTNLTNITLLSENAGGGGALISMVVWLVIMFGLMYLLFIKPQKKQQKALDDQRASMEPGDSIMTTSGFYGTILDIVDDTTVIVEFGNNKNCRIPMHVRAIAEVEKAGSAVVEDEDEK